MKSGEKLILRIVFGAFIAVIGLAVYLEMEYQQSPRFEQATIPGATQSTAVDNQRVRQGVLVIPKGMNPDDLPNRDNRGATVLTLYCTQCHDLPTPAMHSPSEWPDVVARMEDYLRAKQGGMLSRTMMPSKQDWLSLNNYLRDNAQIPIQQERYSDLDSPEAQAYMSVCSQCHEPPSPQLHTQREWPRVVLRMEANMLSAKRRVPDIETRSLIIAFLQRHSKARQPG